MEEKRTPKRWLMWVVVGLILLIYPLSMGPAIYVLHYRVGPQSVRDALVVIYFPLRPLLNPFQDNVIAHIFQGYINWWINQ